MKKYPLSLSPNYVAKWGMAEAVRELIQNALDSDSPFTYEFEKTEYGQLRLRLQSAGIVLPPSKLLLGNTSKANDPDSIGSFGEGFKLALLVLARLGYEVTIYNGPVVWFASFEHSELFNDRMLFIKEEDGDPDNGDLIFDIDGLSDQDGDEIVHLCLLMHSDIGETIETPKGTILLDRKGMLYVGNLFVCRTDMEYGYNVLPKYLPLERDRQTVSSWTLGSVTLEMWVDAKKPEQVADMIDREVKDTLYSQYGGLSEEVKKACFDLFHKRHPGARPVGSQGELERMRQAGSMAIRVNSGMYHAISNYGGYVPPNPPPTPTERLQAFKAEHPFDHRVAAEAFDELIRESKGWERS